MGEDVVRKIELGFSVYFFGRNLSLVFVTKTQNRSIKTPAFLKNIFHRLKAMNFKIHQFFYGMRGMWHSFRKCDL